MSNTPKEQTADYNPIVCDHKIKHGKYKGFSNYEFLSGSSGGGPDGTHDVSLSVCRYCGEIKIQGRRDEKGHTNRFCEEFSIYYHDAVAAIVKNCNYMNRETDGYIPFVQVAAYLNQPPTDDKQPGETLEELIARYKKSIQPDTEREKVVFDALERGIRIGAKWQLPRVKWDGWINVKDKLPLEGEVVDAKTEVSKSTKIIFSNGKFFHRFESLVDPEFVDVEYKNVTHWMPMPNETKI